MSVFRHHLCKTALSPANRFYLTRLSALHYSSNSVSETVVLSRLQSDLKDAMRAKNKPALNTIRALQADIINASKTARPITSDGGLYTLILKQIKASASALEEFQAAKRDDLVTKEQEQLDVLKKYADEIPKIPESEIDILVQNASSELDDGKNFGAVMGKVMRALKGRPADLGYIAKKIEDVVGIK